MQRKLTEREQEDKKYFTLAASKNGLDKFFHCAMQNPVDGVISFIKIPRLGLHNRNLYHMADYFSENGEHLFDKKVNQITISNMQLTGYSKGFIDQMPSGVPFLINLITKNPNIRYLDLSYTCLGDQDALDLLNALEKNTKLEILKLEGNFISEKYLKELEKKLVAKYSFREIRKNARLLKQASSLKNAQTLFATLPDDINIKIASHTGSSLSHSESESLKIARDHYRRP